MIFTITKTSDSKYKEQRVINTLEGLLMLIGEFGEDIIIDVDLGIEIYDEYRE